MKRSMKDSVVGFEDGYVRELTAEDLELIAGGANGGLSISGGGRSALSISGGGRSGLSISGGGRSVLSVSGGGRP